MAASNPIARVKSLDHVVLTVTDIDRTVAWYETHLGMKCEVFESKGDTRYSLTFGSQKINLHLAGHEFEPKAGRVQVGSGDLCFISETPVDEVLRRLKERNVSVLEGGEVVNRTGAVGKLRSVYVRDPDDNLIESVMKL